MRKEKKFFWCLLNSFKVIYLDFPVAASNDGGPEEEDTSKFLETNASAEEDVGRL